MENGLSLLDAFEEGTSRDFSGHEGNAEPTIQLSVMPVEAPNSETKKEQFTYTEEDLRTIS